MKIQRMLILAALALCATAHAQPQPAWQPEKQVEFVVGSGPGGGNDRTARVLQKIWSENKWLQNVTVINKVGGGGAVHHRRALAAAEQDRADDEQRGRAQHDRERAGDGARGEQREPRGEHGDTALLIETTFGQAEDDISGQLFLLPDPGTLRTLLNTLAK